MSALLFSLLVRVLFGAPSFALADELPLQTRVPPCVQAPVETVPSEELTLTTSSTESATPPVVTELPPETPSTFSSSTEVLVEQPVTPTPVTPIADLPEAPIIKNALPASSPDPVPALVALLERITPNPGSGKEQIILSVSTTPTEQTLFGWKLADDTGPIFTITTSTFGAIAFADNKITIALPSAKLNNGGDLVALYDTNGALIDFTRYPSAVKDAVWSRKSDGNWSFENDPLPASNDAPSAVADTNQNDLIITTSTTIPTINATTTTATTLPSTQATTVLAAKKNATSTIQLKTGTLLPPQTIATTTQVTAKAATNKTSSTKNTAKTTAVKATSPQIIHLDSLPDQSTMSQPVRVRLFGFVATSPQLFQKQQFILLNNEGKGLVVKVPSTKQSPPRGSWVSVTGNLELNDSGYTLAMKTNDAWTREKDGAPTAAKRLDDLSPDERLDWTLASAEGEITAIKSTGLTILSATDEIFVAIPSQLSLRPGRFTKGDRVRVQGILDPRKDALTLLIQQTDAISLLPTPAPVATISPTVPEQPWETVLAAGGAVALTHGAQQAHKRYKKHLLARNLRVAEATLLADPGALANQEQIR